MQRFCHVYDVIRGHKDFVPFVGLDILVANKRGTVTSVSAQHILAALRKSGTFSVSLTKTALCESSPDKPCRLPHDVPGHTRRSSNAKNARSQHPTRVASRSGKLFCCSWSPTPSSRPIYLRTSLRWTSSWWSYPVVSLWTFSPLRSKTGLDLNPIFWLTMMVATSGSEARPLTLPLGLLKVPLSLNDPGSLAA